MRRTLIGILSLLLSSFLFAVPASAVNLPDCGGEFTLVAQDQLIFEGGAVPKVINGNVLVTGINGFVRIGPGTEIKGTVTAAKIIFANSTTSLVSGQCVANIIEGANASLLASDCAPKTAANGADLFSAYATAHPTCVNKGHILGDNVAGDGDGTLIASPATGPGSFSALCGPTPVVDNCVNGKPTLTIPLVNSTSLATPLAQGCYGPLVIENGAKLFVGGFNNRFASIRMKAGSSLIGPATVNVNGQFITETGVFITDINLNSAFAAGDVVAILNNSLLTNVVINAPFGRCHPHTGTALDCSEICCRTLDIEPITADCGDTGELCKCPDGFVFDVDPNSTDPTNQLIRSCHRP